MPLDRRNLPLPVFVMADVWQEVYVMTIIRDNNHNLSGFNGRMTVYVRKMAGRFPRRYSLSAITAITSIIFGVS